LESEENDIQVFYEPEEILASRKNQNKDQFAELLHMRVTAAEPMRNKFNIMDYMPKPREATPP